MNDHRSAALCGVVLISLILTAMLGAASRSPSDAEGPVKDVGRPSASPTAEGSGTATRGRYPQALVRALSVPTRRSAGQRGALTGRSRAAPSPVRPATENVGFVGHIGGAAYAVAVQDSYAYLGEGPRLAVLDVSNPLRPNVQSKTPPLAALNDFSATVDAAPVRPQMFEKGSRDSIVRGVAVQGQYAYVAAGLAGLQIIDVADPGNARAVASIDTPGHSVDVVVVDNYAYVADGSRGGLRVIDVADPSRPRQVGTYDTYGDAEALAVNGGYAYVVQWDRGLQVIDISDPMDLQEIGRYDHPFLLGVDVVDGYAYLAAADEGLKVLDVSDPGEPREVGQVVPAEGYAYSVAVAGQHAYLTQGAAGLRLIDVSDPVHPVQVGICDTPDYAYGVTAKENLVYVADRRMGLRLIDASDPTRAREVGHYDTVGYGANLAVSEGYAYVAAYEAGLRVVDISNTGHPREVGHYETTGVAWDVAVAGDYAYITDKSPCPGGFLRIIDVSDPTQPLQVGSWRLPVWEVYGLAVRNGYAYVADAAAGLRVIDVSDPSDPHEVGYDDTLAASREVALGGGYAYVLSSGRMAVVDVSAPTRPGAVGSCDVHGFDVDVFGSQAYVAYTTGMHIIDISDPSHPEEMGHYDPPYLALGVAIARSYAYVAEGKSGLRVLDVRTPSSPEVVGWGDTPGVASDVVIGADLVHVADGYGGLVLLSYTSPEPTYVLSGHVHDPDGEPIANATVSAGSAGAASTNIDGYYNLTGVRAGTYEVAVRKSGCIFASPTRTISLPPDRMDQDFVGRCHFDISGQVRGNAQNPISLVTLSAGPAATATTDADGRFLIKDVVSGTYALTPSRGGWLFLPPARTVSVPPDAPGQDFTMLHPSVSTTLSISGTASVSTTLSYTDTQGLATMLTFPTGAVTEATTIVLAPSLGPRRSDHAFAGHAFDLAAYQAGKREPGMALNEPVTVSIEYSDQDVRVVSDPSRLRLYRWDGSAWLDAGETCDPPSVRIHDEVERRLSVRICHLSRFALLGPTNRTYLPILLRNS